MTTTSGLLLIDKPAGLTSHDVVGRLRQLFGERRIGHAGTLDPMATGLLVLAVGNATRLLRFAQAETKVYVGTVLWGVATDSLDADGVVTQRAPVPAVSLEDLNAIAQTMSGAQRQTPPMVSAIKVGGRRLHELARAGVEVERASREIVIDRFQLSSGASPNQWNFEVTCSVGTYIRVLLSDLAQKVGTVGHLTALRRVSSGHHHVRDAYTLEGLAGRDDVTSVLLDPVRMVESLESVALGDDDLARMRWGQRVALDQHFSGGEVAALDARGALVGVLTRRGDLWKPEIVLTGAGGTSCE